MESLDRRSAAARALVEWKDDLVVALGGDINISPQEQALLEMIVRTRILIDSVDGFLMSQECLVNKKKKVILPVLRERQSLVDSFARLLSQLGLKRREKPLPTLEEYLESKDMPTAASCEAPEPAGERTNEPEG